LSSAVIIPFPSRAPGNTAPEDPAPGNADRLTRALTALDAALAEQRAATTAWRESLATLRGSTHALGTSLRRYHADLQTLETDVGALNTQSRALEAWADAALADAPLSPAAAQ
jgi:predicted trehalose synthase